MSVPGNPPGVVRPFVVSPRTSGPPWCNGKNSSRSHPEKGPLKDHHQIPRRLLSPRRSTTVSITRPEDLPVRTLPTSDTSPPLDRGPVPVEPDEVAPDVCTYPGVRCGPGRESRHRPSLPELSRPSLLRVTKGRDLERPRVEASRPGLQGLWVTRSRPRTEPPPRGPTGWEDGLDWRWVTRSRSLTEPPPTPFGPTGPKEGLDGRYSKDHKCLLCGPRYASRHMCSRVGRCVGGLVLLRH